MATTEHTINDALAEVLRETRHAWQERSVGRSENTGIDALAQVLQETSHAWQGRSIVRSENSGMLKSSNEKPDILVIESSVSPVAIETEIIAGSLLLNQEATSRLGKQIRATGRDNFIIYCRALASRG